MNTSYGQITLSKVNDGASPFSIYIESSNGELYKSSPITTTLTARVFKGTQEISGWELALYGTVNWYLNGGTTAYATGETLTLTNYTITDKLFIEARLEA